MASQGRPRNRPDPGALTAGDSGEAAVHHAIKHGPQALIGGPETTGLQQLQGRLLLRLQPQQGGTLEQQQAAGLGKGRAEGFRRSDHGCSLKSLIPGSKRGGQRKPDAADAVGGLSGLAPPPPAVSVPRGGQQS